MNYEELLTVYNYASELGEELYNTIKLASLGDPMAIATLESLEEFNRLRKLADAQGAGGQGGGQGGGTGSTGSTGGAGGGEQTMPAPTIVCPNCGNEVVPNPDGTCPVCGFNIVAALQAAEAAGMANAAPGSQAAAQGGEAGVEQQVQEKAASIMELALQDPQIMQWLIDTYGHML